MSNIWTAASEGDFDRVRELIEGGADPAGKDDNSYTPLHAAASWNHPELLEYLIKERGADPNTVDDDGETCLFVVESVSMARTCVRLGVDPSIRNLEGCTAAQNLQDEFPHVSLYLRTLTGQPAQPASSNYDDDAAATAATRTDEGTMRDGEEANELDLMTDDLLDRVRQIMERQDEMTGDELDAELRSVVEQAVNRQVEAGREIGLQGGQVTGLQGVVRSAPDGEEDADADGRPKRRREEPGR